MQGAENYHVQYSTYISASEMTCIVSGGALNSTHSPMCSTELKLTESDLAASSQAATTLMTEFRVV